MIIWNEKGKGLHRALSEAGLYVHHEMQNGIAVAIGRGGNDAAIQAIIDNYDELPDRKVDKHNEIKTEALSRITTIFPAITDLDELQLVVEQWKSVVPAARQATTDFQSMIYTYQAARDGIVEVMALVDVDSVKAFNPQTDIVWP